MGVSIRSIVRNAARLAVYVVGRVRLCVCACVRLAVYEEMMMSVKNHHALPTIRPDIDLGTTRQDKDRCTADYAPCK